LFVCLFLFSFSFSFFFFFFLFLLLQFRLDIVRSSYIFADRIWSEHELRSICYPLEEVDFRMDEVICKQNRFATHLYFIQRGECNAFKTLEHDGKMITMSLGRLSKGDCFGLQACGGSTYVQNMRYSVSIVCTTPCSVFTLTRYDVFNRVRPEIKEELQERALHHPWSKSSNLKRRLVNRSRFEQFKTTKKDSILPQKYRDRKKRELEKKKILRRPANKSRLRRSRSNTESSIMLPNILNIEQRPPPSRQCSRKALRIAASQSTTTSTSKSSTGSAIRTSLSSNDRKASSSPDLLGRLDAIDWERVDGSMTNGLLPIEKHLSFPHGVMSAKINKWTKNLTGARVGEEF